MHLLLFVTIPDDVYEPSVVEYLHVCVFNPERLSEVTYGISILLLVTVASLNSKLGSSASIFDITAVELPDTLTPFVTLAYIVFSSFLVLSNVILGDSSK